MIPDEAVEGQVVHTAAELDVLPVYSVILERAGFAWQLMESGHWVSWLNPGESSSWLEAGRRGPFKIIHTGGKA